jgi:hypothetical protein
LDQVFAARMGAARPRRPADLLILSHAKTTPIGSKMVSKPPSFQVERLVRCSRERSPGCVAMSKSPLLMIVYHPIMSPLTLFRASGGNLALIEPQTPPTGTIHLTGWGIRAARTIICQAGARLSRSSCSSGSNGSPSRPDRPRADGHAVGRGAPPRVWLANSAAGDNASLQ